ncbi:MAG: cytochrome c oxidase subunit II [Methanobacteriota archaeon]|nr:MAG: cytochrome c oxidase subunit II [Euryarchaeota archaeon]
MGRRVPYPGIRHKAFHRARSSDVRPEKSYRPTTNTLEESEFRQSMSGLRRIGLVASALALSVAFLGANVRADGISTGQQATDQLFYLVLVPAIGIGILVMGLVAYAVLKFRVRKGHTEGPTNPQTNNRRLETMWTIIPAIILVVVGVAAFQTLITTDTIPQKPDVIVEINAHQWFWNFNITYIRNGTWLNGTGTFTSLNTTGAFSVKAGLTVKLILRSFDVAHSFYLPDFLFKIDVIPGHTNTYWFQSLQPGDYAIRCAEFCGLNHYTMTATLHVVK